MNPIIIMQVDLIEEQEFTFDNFDELKGYLKGKIIYSEDVNTHNKVKEILGLLGFRHESYPVTLGDVINNSQERITVVDNDFFTVYFKDELIKDEDIDINAKELVEDYYKLKENLIYSIIPWPITVVEARNVTNLYLRKLTELSEKMIQEVEELGFTDENVECFFGKHGLKQARQLLDNYEIQYDNLKFIW